MNRPLPTIHIAVETAYIISDKDLIYDYYYLIIM